MARKNNQKHGFPALLSFFLPGLGQLIKGHILKAILIWVGIPILYIFLFFVSPTGFILISLPITLLLWLWNVYDAYNAN